MASMKMIFNIDEVGRLRTKIGQVSQDTNRLYLQLRGQSSNWSGIPLGSNLQQAQVLINELTLEAERLEELIRTAVKGIQNVEAENRRQTNQLIQQFSVLGGLFQRLGGNTAIGGSLIPPSAQTAVMKLITSVSTLSGRDVLSRDPAVQKLQGTVKASTFGSVDWFAAQIKLTEIYEARNQIAKAQTAYAVYKTFGNQTQMDTVHKQAEDARKKLESLGVNKLQYEPGKDLAGYFKQAAVKACDYDPSITTGSVPLLQDESYQLLLRMATEQGAQGEWAKSQLPGKRLEIQLADAAKVLAAKIEAEQRLNGPPLSLPDGTPITAKNKENETTLAYFKDKVYDPNAQLTPMDVMYIGWLEDTYGMTEWRKKVVQADAVAMAFTEALVKETVMGVVDTVEFAFRFVVDPEKATQKAIDQATYLIDHPEALVEAAKTVYHNFEEGTPEERAAMLGSVASDLLPGIAVTKSVKVGRVIGEAQGLADKAMDGVKDLSKVLQNSEKFPNLNPFVTTPEGFAFNFNAGKMTPDNPLPKTSVQEHYLSEMDGLGGGKAGKIQGTGGFRELSGILDRVKELRSQLPSKLKKSGNFGYAEVDVQGINKKEFFAHSSVNEASDKGAIPDISLKPQSEPIFKAKKVDPDNARTDTPEAYLRDYDTEYKILNDIASQLGDNKNAKGTVNLFTERLTCQSCSDVIMSFRREYPNITVNIITNNGNVVK